MRDNEISSSHFSSFMRYFSIVFCIFFFIMIQSWSVVITFIYARKSNSKSYSEGFSPSSFMKMRNPPISRNAHYCYCWVFCTFHSLMDE